ncbi:MAG: DUF58 domain-containing protein [Paludibacteraceae bacterium]|nr:DUF58 domain-containing protein [Paludibacteraceae bacterium]
MEASELLKKVRQIEIKTRGLSRNIFAGEYHTAFKGKGMTFSEVREYQYGDDVRNIDWNVTARFNNPFIKIFEEERELTVMLLIDVSGSREFGTVKTLKRDVITEIAATLAFSAIQNNDKIGVIFFSDRIEKCILPQKGKKHILYIIRELIDFKPESRKTDISVALRYFTNMVKKRSTAFLISDFMDKDVSEAMTIANKKHDIVAVQVYDKRETILPKVGYIKLKDAETEQRIWVNTNDSKLRQEYENYWSKKQNQLQHSLKKSGVDFVSISTDEDYVKSLIQLFKLRS